MTSDERQITIPKDFSIAEQIEEIGMVWKSRREYIDTRVAKGKAVAPSRDLAEYSLARIEAIGRTLKALQEGAPPPIVKTRDPDPKYVTGSPEDYDDGF